MPDTVMGANPFTQQDVDVVLKRELAMAAKTSHPQKSPRAILLAGQPGAGKTELSTMLIAALDDDAVFINADEYRRYCPGYRKLYEERGSDVVSLTAPFSAAVTERLISLVSDQRRHLVIEGTGRTVEVPRSTAQALTAKGYTAQMAVIAARPEVSLASTLLRFCRMNEGGTIPRATALEAHDAVVSALPDNLDVLLDCPCISRIRIWDRTLRILYDSETDTGRPSEALLDCWRSRWTQEELDETQRLLETLRSNRQLAVLGQGHVLAELTKRIENAARS